MDKNKLSRLFTSLQESPIQTPPPATDIVEILARILLIQVGIQPPPKTDGEEKKSEDTHAVSDCLGISTPDLKSLLQLCVKKTGGEFQYLPKWFQQCG